jgi:hypothetical protein
MFVPCLRREGWNGQEGYYEQGSGFCAEQFDKLKLPNL